MNKLLTGATALLLGVSSYFAVQAWRTSDPVNAAVMIVGQGTGGTGSIIETSASKSTILTNAHVCNGAVRTGSSVITRDRKIHQIQSVLLSENYDLCLITVDENLKHSLKIASESPTTFENATVVGHPQLLPTVISKGLFGDKLPITLLVDAKKCTEKDFEDPNKAIYCIFFGLYPIFRTYESQLVSALIMPGNSGSAIVNSNNEISAVVYAGNGRGLSFAFAMPLEAIQNFVADAKDREFTSVEAFTTQRTGEPSVAAVKVLMRLISESTACATSELEACKVMDIVMPLEMK